ncbi:MAG: serine/threonine-protein kinase, partial [Myxococcota bacterium]
MSNERDQGDDAAPRGRTLLSTGASTVRTGRTVLSGPAVDAVAETMPGAALPSDEQTLGGATGRLGFDDATMPGEGNDSPLRTGSGRPPRSEQQELERGTPIGSFIVERKLGAGAMGVVLLARDPELARPVAIKLVASGAGDTDGHQRLLREAQAAARLSHPNVVAVHQAGTWKDQVFIVMEYVDGGTLREWVRNTRPAWQEIVDAFRQAGKGLAAAHAAGLVHRDFKPDNVLIGRDGRVRVSDFGLVGVSGLAPELRTSEGLTSLDVALTQTGAVLGTPAYMAPEQFEGAQVDARADQFAFGVALFEALYGTRPYPGSTAANLLFSIAQGNVVQPAASPIPPPIHRAIVRAVAGSPDARHPSMEATLAALEWDPSAKR